MVESDTSCVGHVFFRTRVVLDQYRNAVSRAVGKKMQGRELTERQQEVLDHIREHIQRWGLPPSRSELARSLGLKFGVSRQLPPGSTREKRLGAAQPREGPRHPAPARGKTAVSTPNILPTVPAGTPMLADESKAVLQVPNELARQVHPQADFYVVVRGDSMSCVGYRSGDVVAVKRNPDPSDGDIVVARIGTDITLKCFHRPSATRVELRPRSTNPEHRPIVIDENTTDWEIVGVVVGAIIGARESAKMDCG